MCGISGFINIEGEYLSEVKKMNTIIRHRGPDDEGYAVFEGEISGRALCMYGEDSVETGYPDDLKYRPIEDIDAHIDNSFKIAFGHRRLSILDLSSLGHQPMCSDDGRYWIVFNGEIYNYIELREELIESGVKFKSSTDTEVILAAYHIWGSDCLNRFNGMWAFAIYDSEKDEIFMARDRYGIKPFYYWFNPNGTLCFGSEIKQFTGCSGWQAILNSQRAYDYLVYSWTDHTDETMFEGVYHLPAATFYKSSIKNIEPDDRGRITHTKWYNPRQSRFTGDSMEAATGFREHFKNAVKLHLRSDVPVGSALSGGLDSSAIVCEINSLLRKEEKEGIQKTFSSCSTDQRYDEKKWMDVVVGQTEVDAHFVYPQFEDVFRMTPEIIWHQDEPYQSQSAFLGYHVFHLAKENNIKVLLNGQGADEYLGGYGQFQYAYYSELFKKGHWKVLKDEIKSGNNGSVKSAIQHIIYLNAPDRVKRLGAKVGSETNRIKQLISMEKLGASDQHPMDSIPITGNSVSEISELFMMYSPLPKYLRWEDRNSMAHSIEARVPFLDFRLVEFVQSLPTHLIYSEGETKKVMRLGLMGILPEEIANRKDKKGFITPEQKWVKEEFTDVIKARLKEAVASSNGIIKESALPYFDKVVSGELPFDYTYWRLILFSEWMKCFNVQLKG
jgi:asparagine synthase (glutamine-hydrolysing)